MEHILNFVMMGIIAGLIGSLWTRIIKSNMIFASIGKYLKKQDDISLVHKGRHHLFVKFLRCLFCMPIWVAFLLDIFYILDQSPHWTYVIIGVFASMGASNLVAEVICALRNEA